MLKEIETAKLKSADRNKLISPRTIENGELKLVASKDWTSGFFSGGLWYIYELTGKDSWKQQAKVYTEPIEQEKLNGGTHDMGFKIYCSFGNGYRLTKDSSYKDIIKQAAGTLAKRYNPEVKAIRSWDHNADKWGFPVIIDNMMNLELLFETALLTGDSYFYEIAVNHANTTLKNHFRPDYSTWHVINYNRENGEVKNKHTYQGYNHDSSWARGQAWALYGYTMCYRYTKDNAYLKQAEKIVEFIFSHENMPEDLIPYWDFDVEDIRSAPRDVSAAAIIASALYELSDYSVNKKDHTAQANQILSNLSRKYSSRSGENKGFILEQSTGSKPSESEVNVPLIYADYYYLEAITRKLVRNK